MSKRFEVEFMRNRAMAYLKNNAGEASTIIDKLHEHLFQRQLNSQLKAKDKIEQTLSALASASAEVAGRLVNGPLAHVVSDKRLEEIPDVHFRLIKQGNRIDMELISS